MSMIKCPDCGELVVYGKMSIHFMTAHYNKYDFHMQKRENTRGTNIVCDICQHAPEDFKALVKNHSIGSFMHRRMKLIHMKSPKYKTKVKLQPMQLTESKMKLNKLNEMISQQATVLNYLYDIRKKIIEGYNED